MIREYKETDEEAVVNLVAQLQKFLLAHDDGNFLKEFDDDGQEYFQHLLWSIKDQEGKIFVCEQDGVVVGFVAGYLEKVDRMDQLMSSIKKPGYVAELFVNERSRGKGYGGELMKSIEGYFKSLGCDVVTVTVDAFNKDAGKMYGAVGYKDHDILMLKRI